MKATSIQRHPFRPSATLRVMRRIFLIGALATLPGWSTPTLDRARLSGMPEGELLLEHSCPGCESPTLNAQWKGDWVLEESSSLQGGSWRAVRHPSRITADGLRGLEIPIDYRRNPRKFFRLREITRGLATEGILDHRFEQEESLLENVPSEIHQSVGPLLDLRRARHQPVYKIRIRAIRTANTDGTQSATITAAGVKLLVDQANVVYHHAGIEFLFDPATDFETRNSDVLNHDFSVIGDPAQYTDPDDNLNALKHSSIHTAMRATTAYETPDRITVFFRWGDKLVFDESAGHWKRTASTGGSSSWGGAYVNMPRMLPEKNLLAHELGHYLHNRHPFVGGVKTVADAAERIRNYVMDGHAASDGLTALDGDRNWVLDTPADAAGSIYKSVGLDHCDEVAIPIPVGAPVNETYYLEPDKHNIMSYFKHCHSLGHWLTEQQIARMRDGLENGNRHRLIERLPLLMRPKLEQIGQAHAGWVDTIEMVRTRHRQIVTAVTLPSSHRLKLIAWHVDENGLITRKGDIETVGEAHALSVQNMGLGLVATAIRAESGYLKVILWQVDEDGNFERRGSANGTLSSIQLGDVVVHGLSSTRLGNEYLVTGVSHGLGMADKLYLTVWRVTASGELSRVCVAEAGKHVGPDLAPAGRGNQMVALLRSDPGNLKLIAWTLQDGQLLRTDEAVLPEEGLGEVVRVDTDLLSTACRVHGGALKIINWEIDDYGQLTRLDSFQDTACDLISATRLGVDVLGTAVTGPGDYLRLSLWRVANGGVVKSDTETHVKASRVGTTQVGSAKLAVAYRDENNSLRVEVWKTRERLPIRVPFP